MINTNLFDYTLTIIEDEQVALAGSIPGTPTGGPIVAGTVFMVLILSVVLAFVCYLVRLRYYQTRLMQLTQGTDVVLGTYNKKSIRSVRNEIAVAENNLAADSLEGIVDFK